MRILVYEFITGGGLFRFPDQPLPAGSLLAEGAAMRDAVCEDFGQLPDVSVSVLLDSRIVDARSANSDVMADHISVIEDVHQHDSQLRRRSAEADWSVIIAPELGNQLWEVARLAQEAGAALLSPTLEQIAWASDKNATVRNVRSVGLRTPRTIRTIRDLDTNRGEQLVAKPILGAGSEDVQAVSVEYCEEFLRSNSIWRVESLCHGTPASISILLGDGQPSQILPPCSQRISEDGRFRYFGGEVLTDPALTERARAIAQPIAELFRGGSGYLGIDLLFGDAADGSEDVVIEINPRLTTSYTYLRDYVSDNLARRMLELAGAMV